MSVYKNNLAVATAIILSSIIRSESIQAEPTLELYIRDADEVFDGTPLSTSVSADGHISLGLTETSINHGAKQPATCMALDKEKIYLGTAGGGLLEINKKTQTSKVIHEAPNLVISTVAQRKSRLWYATGPKGKIYDYHNGQATEWLTPESEYVWSLLPEDNAVLAATGRPGQVIRVHKGHSEVLFAPEESHIRTLHQHPTMGVIAGGGSQGIVYQLLGKDKARALYDSDLEEVTSIVSNAKTKDLYVALVSSKEAASLAPGTWIGPVGDEKKTATKENPIKASEVVRIRSSGYVEQIWASKEEGALGLTFDSASATLYIAATGMGSRERGRIYAINTKDRDRVTLLSRIQAPMATAIERDAEGLWIATAPNGVIYRLGPKTRGQGTYDSVEQDLGRVARIGQLWFDADIPPKAQVELQLRTGNTEKPDTTWSSWSSAARVARGTKIEVPNGRYAQFRATLYASPEGHSPRLKSMHASIRRKNLPPKISDIYTLKPGVYLKAIPTENEREKTVALSESTFRSLRRQGIEPDPRPRARAGEAPGKLTLVWEVSDPNRDTLLYSAELIDESGQSHPLKEKLKAPFITFDARAYADGTYRAKIIASDRPWNRPRGALSDKRISDAFTIDNSPPEVKNSFAKKLRRGWEISAEVTDTHSRLRRASVSINGDPWILLPSSDGLLDGYTEQLQLRFKEDQPVRSIKIRVEDQVGNIATLPVPLRK